ncbi:polygalacturonase-like [Gossypium australe]|uniref:Polygalacturonase n=1 Tax=Gossypium australe TaxID=47621 RepID=A0A5B6UAA6_9ROSI|nr:polygalacturonase-like [Gossypium australe]
MKLTRPLHGIILILFVMLAINSTSATTKYNVLSFGAKPNGKTDSTKAFLMAWEAACSSADSTMIYVPKGRYLLGSMAFKGGCKSPQITIRIDGTLVAPQDYRVLGKSTDWLSFEGVNGISILGGALDAKGPSLWACKASHSNCPSGATTLSFTNSKNIRIRRLLSLNSQMFHIVINGCENVHVQGVRIIAAGDSPNTDGIHVQLSKNVNIIKCSIKTGDDCISIGPGTKNLWVEQVTCGPGHGISIGSLAKDLKEEGVQNVTIRKTTFMGTQNGLRIKSWARPSTGFVQGVRFLDSLMRNVQNPIVIDQNYCPHNLNCPSQVSGIKIKDIIYEDIRGTSSTQVAIKFDCSPKNPCTGIRLQNVNLSYLNKPAQSSCSNVLINSTSALTKYNVLNFGAKPNGKTDSTKAFLMAWKAACASADSTIIYVPKGRYLLGSMAFQGGCKSPQIIFRIDGTLVAPQDYRVLGKSTDWLSFEGVNGVSILGGALDAKGPSLWACKASHSNCPSGATTLSFANSKNIRIRSLLSLNSQMFHIVINGCENVNVQGVRIIAAGNSPNTDGIHVQLSKNVNIIKCSIKTGDDCISIGPGTKNLWVEQVTCGPGHGISIGSLAKDLKEEGVQNITMKKTIFLGTQNGLRIKSWARPSTGFVQGVRFMNSLMVNVQNPIVIDQNYCPHNLNCPNQVSGIKIKDIIYEGIRGTSSTQVAIKFDCSPKNPCTGIRLQNINLSYLNKPAQSSCSNVRGKALNLVRPETINSTSALTKYNVLNFGAKPNGKTDSTKAFLMAWKAACASADSTIIYVPKGRYLLGSMAFQGGCKSPQIIFRIDGTLVAPQDYRVLGKSTDWLSFEGVNGVSILGGALDAKGPSLWACKASHSNCPSGATTLSFTNSKNIRIRSLLSLNSQMFHIVINGCENVNVQGVRIIAAGNSPNTDGIHVQLSKNVNIIKCSIKTGDDCISIGPGTKNLWAEQVTCGTQNGLRIKSWARPSTGFVQGVRFMNSLMVNVQNPIVIDQNYCPHNLNCPNQVSGIKIKDIIYEGIRGTSSTQVAIKFDCSSKNPCIGIRLQNVNLSYLNKPAQSSCSNVRGKALNLVRLESCL